MRKKFILTVLVIFIVNLTSFCKAENNEACVIYKSRHRFQVCFPKNWFLDKDTLEKYSTVREAQKSFGNHFTIRNYDAEKRILRGGFKENDIKIDINIYSDFQKSLDEWVKEGDSIISQEPIYINGDKAYMVVWESDIPDYKALSVYYVKGKSAVEFACDPSYTIHKDDFIKIVKSFKFMKEADNS